MDNRNNSDAGIGGNLIAVLLDLDECPSNVGEVAAVSDQQLMLIRRDRNELVGVKHACLDIPDCKCIEYRAGIAMVSHRGDSHWFRAGRRPGSHARHECQMRF